MNIEWRDVFGYEGSYEVSNDGQIRSKDRVFIKSNGVLCERKGQDISTSSHRNGYKQAGLRKPGSTKQHYIHRMVAIAFLPREEGKNCVNHKDSNKENNHVSNLEWCTQKENVDHYWAIQNHKKNGGTYNQIPLEAVSEIVRSLNDLAGMYATKYGVDKRRIYELVDTTRKPKRNPRKQNKETVDD